MTHHPKARSFNFRSGLTGSASAVALALLLVSPSAAQMIDDEIVVTARKTEESIQDIPISVSAFSGDALLEQNIDNISELSDFTAGFQQQQAFGRSQDRPVIRGTSNILSSDGKVGVFIDGIPFFGISSTLDFSNLERVEIIKGPQSAVFGRGTLSGAINYVTRKPGEEKLEGQIRAEIAEYGQQEVSGFANIRVNDWLALSLNGKYYDLDGAFDNTLGGKLGAQSTETFSGAVFLDPTETLSLSLRYIYNQDDDGLYPINLLGAANNNCFLDTRGYFCGEAPTPETYALNVDDILEPGNFRESDRLLFDATWDLTGTGTELTYQFGLTDTYSVGGIDQTYDGNQAFFLSPFVCARFIPNSDCSASAFNGTSASTRVSQTHEVKLFSDEMDNFRWRLGTFFSNDQSRPLPEFLERTEFGPDSLGDISEVENFAVYGGFEIDLSDRMSVGVELRYAQDDITATSQLYPVEQYFPLSELSVPTQIIGSTDVREASFESVTPRFTVDYTLDDGSLLYGQFAQGNSPGGFNPTDAPQTTFEEEKLTNLEIGAKTSKWGFDRLNVAAFYNVFDNQVLTNTFTTAAGGVNSFRANIGETEILGFELEFARYLTDDWTIYGTYGFLDAEITQGVDRDQAILFGGAQSVAGGASVCTNLDNAIPAGGTFSTCREAGSLVGNTPPLVSKHQLALGTRYDFRENFEPADFYVGGDLIYRSSFYAQVHNLIETGDATLVNLRLGVEFDAFTLQFWGKNVFDQETPAGILRYVDFNAPRAPVDRPRAFGITPQNPSQWGVTAMFNF